MPEAVIVATARSPIGRAFKGSLKRPSRTTWPRSRCRPRSTRSRGSTRATSTTSCSAAACPAASRASTWAASSPCKLGYDFLPGTTITRYCSSSLQTTRMAFHAIKAGEGDAFISAGVETVSRFVKGNSDIGDAPEPGLRRRRRAHAPSAPRAASTAGPTRARTASVPDVYISMGQTAENVALFKDVSREEMDEFAARSQNLAEKAIANGFWEREITPYTLEDGTVVDKDDGPRAGTTVEGMAGLKPVFRPDGRVTAGNACPLNDGAAAVIVMSDTKAKELGLTPLARIVSTAVTGLSPEIMGHGPVDAIKLALKRAGKTVDDIDLFEINEAFAAQVLSSSARGGHPAGQAERPRRRHRRRPPVRHDRRAHHRHAHQRPADLRQDLRRRVDVRRRRHGHGDGDRAPQLVRTCVPTAGSPRGPAVGVLAAG